MSVDEPSPGDIKGEVKIERLLEAYNVGGREFISETDEVIFERLQKNRSHIGTYYAGAIALDMACRSEVSDPDRIEWFQQSIDIWHNYINNSYKSGVFSSYAIKAMIGQANSSAYHSIFLQDKLPNNDLRTKMYDQLCKIGELAHIKFTKKLAPNADRQTKNEINDNKRLAGILGEMAVLMLHQRLTLHEEGMESQLALISRVSEDYGSRSGSKAKGRKIRAWDVSIYQQDKPSEISMPYKLQVKSSRDNRQKNVSFASDINVIYVRETLSVPRHERRVRLSPFMIVNDLVQESHGKATDRIINFLNQREQKLLDRLDQPPTDL